MFQGDKLCGKFPHLPPYCWIRNPAINPVLRCRKPWKLREKLHVIYLLTGAGFLSTVWAYCTDIRKCWKHWIRTILQSYQGLCFYHFNRQIPLKNTCSYGGFLKWWYPTTMGFPTKNDQFGVFWGYHHLRKHPYVHHSWHFHERRPGPQLPTAELPHWACECEQTSVRIPGNSCAGFQCPTKSGWWLNQPIVKMGSFPQGSGWK